MKEKIKFNFEEGYNQALEDIQNLILNGRKNNVFFEWDSLIDIIKELKQDSESN